MGRDVKRVPIGFDWPMYHIWWGYRLTAVFCKTCQGKGKGSRPMITGFLRRDGTWDTSETENCPTCGGVGETYPKVEIPSGPGFQLWEVTSEGSPISPVFATAEELAAWLYKNDDAPSIDHWMPYEDCLHYVISNGGPNYR